jgi:hypothetical protein
MMKRLTLMGLLLLLLAGCSAPTLDDYVNEFKNRMPEDMGNGLVMTDIGVVDDYLQIECTNDESELQFDNPLIKSLLPAVAAPLKAAFVDEADMKDFMQACANEGKGFRMIVTGTKSNVTLPFFEVTPEELQEKFPPTTKE